MAADAFGEKSASTVAVVTTGLGTLVAMGLFPLDPAPQGALAWNAGVMSAGILFVPAFRILRRAPTMMNTENFVALGYVYWILLDLIQGAYNLRDAKDEALRAALFA